MLRATTITTLYWDGTLPVDPMAIAAKMGLQVEAADLGDNSLELCPGVIRYSLKDDPVRQRFSVAHAIGHHIENRGEPFRSGPERFSMVFPDPGAQEANMFACALLMPRDAVDRSINDGITDFTQLSVRFGVSTVALRKRLIDLKWLDNRRFV